MLKLVKNIAYYVVGLFLLTVIVRGIESYTIDIFIVSLVIAVSMYFTWDRHSNKIAGWFYRQFYYKKNKQDRH